LAALEQGGVPIDCLAGTSAGAIVAALYCAGLRLDQVYTHMARMSWWLFARPVWPRRGFFSFAPLEQWVAGLIGDATFEQLPRPLAVVATDLELGEPVVLTTGRVARAVHASCAVPGFVEPVEHAGRLLFDGGSSNNLPAKAARALGADYVIGVDLFRPHIRRGLGPLAYGLAAVENFVRRSGGGLDACDALIVPDLAGATYLRFSQRERFVALGRQAAEVQVPVIRAALGLGQAASAAEGTPEPDDQQLPAHMQA
jgi:NTE family protein